MSKLKYFDGTNWNEVNGNIVGDTLPIGAIVPYCSTTAPANWLVCDGSYVSKETYADLYNIIGDDYLDGGTAPTGTFRLPNLKGKVPVGYNSSETEFDTMGETGGEKKHTLTINEMPSHSHAPNNRATTFAGTGSNAPSQTGGDRAWDNLAIGNTGGGQAHNNLQPYQVVCYIIKAKQSAGVVANVSNAYSTSQTDTYSCDYVNKNIIKCKTTTFTPTYSASSTSQGGYFATSLDTKTISGLGNSDTILSAYVTPVGYQASYNFFIQEFTTDFSQFGVYCSSQAQLILTVLYK